MARASGVSEARGTGRGLSATWRGAVVLVAAVLLAGPAVAAEDAVGAEPRRTGFFAAAVESLTGDVYANPERWRPLSWGTLFSEGWDEPWVSPPKGLGGAPRQGWLNSADGVFYRLAVGGPTYTAGREGRGGDVWQGDLTLYLPLSRRLELQLDLPLVRATQDFAGSGTHSSFGDLRVSPRIMLSETRALSQSLSLTFVTPTGNNDTGTGLAAFLPNYQFWANWWSGLVVRGNVGWKIAYHDVTATGARTGFFADLAGGYYWTSHEAAPFGDFVTLLSANVFQPTDSRSDHSYTEMSLTPGFRTHLGANWYLLGAIEVPMTSPVGYDYRVSTDLMYVF